MTMVNAAGPTPGTITAARVIGWIQVGLTTLGTGFLLIVAVAFTSAANDIDDEKTGLFSGLAGAFAGVLVVIVLVLIALIAAIMVPLILLRPGRPGAGTALVVVEAILVALDLLSIVGSDSPGAGPIIAMLSGVAMIVLLSVAPSRAWLRSGASAVGAGPYPYPGMPSYPPAGWAGPGGQWAADPSGRHQQRYHDGTMWTAWVSDNGVNGQDPL